MRPTRPGSEKAMAPYSSTLAWKISWTEEPGRLQSLGSLRVGHDWATSLSLFTFMHWRRKWQPTPVFLPGESQGWGSLVGCCLLCHLLCGLHRVGHDWSDLAAAAAAGQGKYRYLELSLLGNHLSPSHLCLLVPASSPSRALGLLGSGSSSSFHRQAFSSSSSLPFSLLLSCVPIFVSFFFSCFISSLPCFYPCYSWPPASRFQRGARGQGAPGHREQSSDQRRQLREARGRLWGWPGRTCIVSGHAVVGEGAGL